MKRLASSTKVRRDCFDYWQFQTKMGPRLMCGGSEEEATATGGACKVWLDPIRDQWEAEHFICRANGGSDSPPNVRPMCLDCHAKKTSTDIPLISKGKRQSNRHFGIERRGGGWRR